MSLYNILVSAFKLNYWNKWTFARFIFRVSPVYIIQIYLYTFAFAVIKFWGV